MNVDAVSEKILNRLNDQIDELGDSVGYRPWTVGVKGAIARLGRKMEYEVAVHNRCCKEAEFGEWLFDVTWLKYKKDGDTRVHLVSMPLVAECEWGNKGDVEDDFEKLLVVNAELRVLIFEAKK